MASPTPSEFPYVPPDRPTPSFRGVYEADPNHPPLPPVGANAIEIKDHTGRVVGFAWLAPEFDVKEIDGMAWSWLDRHDPFMPAFGQFRLIR